MVTIIYTHTASDKVNCTIHVHKKPCLYVSIAIFWEFIISLVSIRGDVIIIVFDSF